MYICTRQMSLSAHANAMTSVGTVLVPLSLMSWLAVVCRVSLCYNLLETWVRLVSQKTVRISCMEKGYKGGMEERARKKGNAVTVQCTMAVHRRPSSSRCSIG